MISLNQAEADALLSMQKYCIGSKQFAFSPHKSLRIPLYSLDKREVFSLDIWRGGIALKKNNFQTRARTSMVLARLDLGGAPHRNPDGEEISCPHLHLYREGYGDKWAFPLPDEFFGISDVIELLEKFMSYCAIVDQLVFHRGGL